MSLKEQVFEALNNALDSGYDYTAIKSPHGLLQVAQDMIEYDADLEQEKEEDLVPLIKEWQLSKA